MHFRYSVAKVQKNRETYNSFAIKKLPTVEKNLVFFLTNRFLRIA